MDLQSSDVALFQWLHKYRYLTLPRVRMLGFGALLGLPPNLTWLLPTRGTITNALNTDTPSRYLQTLIGIIAAMSDYTIEAETVTVCRVVKKSD
ncbi:MAG: hypothetical protein O7B35_07545 [Deltaproteobacteria bacterium]|nr:hypothetical protein [Deltaproteobacteria bacterium]